LNGNEQAGIQELQNGAARFSSWNREFLEQSVLLYSSIEVANRNGLLTFGSNSRTFLLLGPMSISL
jgi:hypothetical protein